MSERAPSALNERQVAMANAATRYLGLAGPHDAEGTWQMTYSATALTMVDAIRHDEFAVLPPIVNALRERIAALELGEDTVQAQRQIGYLSGLLAVLRQWSNREPGDV